MRQKQKKELVSNEYLFPFMQETIVQLQKLGKTRTAETYQSALASFMRFREGKDVLISHIKDNLIVAYENSMKASGLSSNTTSFYMRILRAVYNRAVKQGITKQKYPFQYVYTGVAKTRKRAVDISIVRRLAEMDLDRNPSAALARDMFLFSFYTRGMSFIDMAYLRKSDLSRGILTTDAGRQDRICSSDGRNVWMRLYQATTIRRPSTCFRSSLRPIPTKGSSISTCPIRSTVLSNHWERNSDYRRRLRCMSPVILGLMRQGRRKSQYQ